MSGLAATFSKRLSKKARKGFRGWPMATIAFYGPDLSRASKVVVGIVPGEGREVIEMRKWFSNDGDVRREPAIGLEIEGYLSSEEVRSVTMIDRIIGCPHEGGVDYDGESCPSCAFWMGRDRFTGKLA